MTSSLHRMLTIRYLETRLQELCDRGEAGDLHFNRGQEAISVGVCSALRTTDRIVTHHRTIAHYLAKGGELYPLVAEVLNRTTGMNGGLAGEMHLSDPRIGYEFSFQLVGTCLPAAAGLAWALKYHHKSDDIVVCFMGDAATANGQFHEGINIAAVRYAPLLVVIEDNGRAGNITPEYYSIGTVESRFSGYGIGTLTVDGNEVDEVRNYALAAIRDVRKYLIPVALICKTERLCWHKQGQRDARTPEQLAAAELGDPLRGMDIPEEIRQEVDAAILIAQQDPKAEWRENG